MKKKLNFAHCPLAKGQARKETLLSVENWIDYDWIGKWKATKNPKSTTKSLLKKSLTVTTWLDYMIKAVKEALNVAGVNCCKTWTFDISSVVSQLQKSNPQLAASLKEEMEEINGKEENLQPKNEN